MSLRLAVFASGSGTNLQALLDRFHGRADSPVRLVLVVSDRVRAGALERARKAGIEAVVVPVAGRPIDYVARELLAALESADVDLIVLAGYLRLVPPAVVRHYRQRIINIHPALLPAFGGQGMFGLRVHRAVIESGATVTGVTVHMVDEQYDEGRIIAQWPVPVLPGDSAESLANRVLRVEHLLYPAAVEALARALEQGSATTRLGPQSPEASYDYQLNAAPVGLAMRRALGLG
ncbi:MAG: phosphoribosylglycinamide formyltransferase [Longimicrobiales bacterium]